jgi:homoserine dehydrogenase
VSGRVLARVTAREIPLADPFALAEGTGSILRLTTDIAGKIVLTEENQDLSTTAYEVISDLFRLKAAARGAGSADEGRIAGNPHRS